MVCAGKPGILNLAMCVLAVDLWDEAVFGIAGGSISGSPG